MKKLNNSYNCLLIFVLIIVSSCSRQQGIENILAQAENIVEQQPDSALHLLNAVLFPEDLNKKLFNKYHLLLLQAKDKSNRNITSDTVIFAVKDYYLQKKDYQNAALAAFYCGRVRHEQNNVNKAVEAYSEAERLANQTENNNLKGLIQANWGILHFDHYSYEKAIEFLKNAVGLYGKAKNYRNEAGALRITGDCFLLSDKIDSAFYYYNKSLKLADSCNLPEMQSDIKQSMGISYREQGLYEQAKKLFMEALALPSDSVEHARILLNIADVYVLEDKTDSVNYYLDKALDFQISDPHLACSSWLLKSTVAEKNNCYPEALKYYKEFHKSTEDVFDSEKNNKLLEIQGKYDYEKLRVSKKASELKDQKALTALLLALFVSAAIIFIYNRKSARNKRLLLETEQKIESIQKMAADYSKENNIFRHIVLEHFDILRKTALLEKEMESGQKMVKKFNEIVYNGKTPDWDKMYQVMDNLKNGLYSKIRNKYPMSETEFRICCLTCETDFSDKEIMVILGTTLNMVRRIRSDLRKKLGMQKGEDFLTFFEKTV